MNNSNILFNQWDRLKYYDPAQVLIKLREYGKLISDTKIDEKLRTLRTNKLKPHKQGREAALFCYGLGNSVLKTKVLFARDESSDYDIITRWNDEESIVYTPVQLKEIVPKRINPKATLEKEISKLSKYTNSTTLVVAIYLNQRGRFNFENIKIPNLKIAELWLFGALKQDQSEWFLYGDLLKTANFYKFNYPLA